LPGQRPLLGAETVVGQRVVYVVEGPFDVRFVLSKLVCHGDQGMRG
jgi:hypothetical protein